MILPGAKNGSGSELTTNLLKGLRQYAVLTGRDKALLLLTALCLTALRLTLWFVPYRNLKHWLKKVTPPHSKNVNDTRVDPEHLAWIVTRAGVVVPDSTCLSQAIVLQKLMEWHGHDSRMRIGVARDDLGHVRGHAWLEWNGNILIGGSNADSLYAPISALDEERP